MIFDPNDPFPLIETGASNYAQAKQHSELVDRFLGFEISKVEQSLRLQASKTATTNTEDKPQYLGKNQETWMHIDPQSFQTPYSELRWMLHLLEARFDLRNTKSMNEATSSTGSSKMQKIVDLGCAYGRIAFVIGHHYPSVHFVGYELVPERVAEGQRVLAKHNHPLCFLYEKNLEFEKPPEADFYFIYDFGKQHLINKTLQELGKISRQRPIVVIARGRGTRSLIQSEHPWLCEINEPLHTEHFSIYRS